MKDAIVVNDFKINPRKKNKMGFIYYLKRDKFLYLLLLLPITYFIIFKYGPLYGVLIAFKDYNIFQGVLKSKWIGLTAFKELFAMADFYKVVRNTLMLNGLDLIVGFPAPIILAIILNELKNLTFKKTTQTLLYLPHFLSWVIVGDISYQIFSSNGLVNGVIKSLGGTAVPFLSDKWHWLATYLGIGVWQSIGWGTIIYLAAITGIGKELYEAAEVDGADRLRRIWHITLPCIKPTVIILLILQLGRMVSIGFDRPFIIGNPLVQDFSDVISTFVYRVGLGSGDFTRATAVGLFQSVVSLIFLLGANFIAEKSGEQGIW
ncbi:MAG TPA: ABC transporter permease subunit [Clostridiaceae bacterium]